MVDSTAFGRRKRRGTTFLGDGKVSLKKKQNCKNEFLKTKKTSNFSLCFPFFFFTPAPPRRPQQRPARRAPPSWPCGASTSRLPGSLRASSREPAALQQKKKKMLRFRCLRLPCLRLCRRRRQRRRRSRSRPRLLLRRPGSRLPRPNPQEAEASSSTGGTAGRGRAASRCGAAPRPPRRREEGEAAAVALAAFPLPPRQGSRAGPWERSRASRRPPAASP